MLHKQQNVNSVWATILVETYQRLGLKTAVICPGSRSTPLAIAFGTHPHLEAIPILDERSAGFLALGVAKKTGLPVVLVCTSGTAGANFYPAVIEAKESRIPLLLLTADRPPELRDCHAGQTIDQVKLYGHYPNWQTELAMPSLEKGILKYLRQMLIYSWERSLFPVPGPVHINLPFRDPLAPIVQPEIAAFNANFDWEDFLAGIESLPLLTTKEIPFPSSWKQGDRGIIIAGIAQPPLPERYCQAIANLSQYLQWPVLAEGLSPVRNYAALNPYLISTYDLILRNQELAQQLTPDLIIQIGELPTSKELRGWIESSHARIWVIDPSHHNLDALHHQTIHLRATIEQVVIPEQLVAIAFSKYLQLWWNIELKTRQKVHEVMTSIDQVIEPKVAWLISQCLPPETPIFIANSMPVRDVEFFWTPNNLKIQPFFNRGANGIDGTLSTALGIAHRSQNTVMLTGDLALLHDTNGFLLRNKFIGHLTIILINNNGGGIFEMLPIANFDLPFEEFFATPQHLDFAKLCATYGVEHNLITSWTQLQQLLNPLPTQGIRVLELPTNRKKDAFWRKTNLGKFA